MQIPLRLSAAASLVALIAGCTEPLDLDLRGNLGGFSTTDAAQSVSTADRPKADARGIISYPSYQVAVARRDDTVADVANRIGLSPTELATFNGMQPEDKLREGEVLALPRRVSEPPAGTPGSIDIATLAGDAIDSAPDTTPVQTEALPPAKSQTKAQAKAMEPIRHKVARGETAYTISRLYQVPVESLAEWNGLGSDFAIREGQYLLIPIKNQPAPEQLASAAAAASVPSPGAGSPTPTPPSATKPLPEEKVAVDAPETPDVSVGAPTKPSSAAMTMPVQGKIIGVYVKGKNDGLDIAGSSGAAVKAADGGSVAAITQDADQIPIIILRHDSDLLTVYANVTDIAVKKGDRVNRGQTIAKLREGDNAYLHFEVRDGFDSVDPAPYLQ